MEVRDLRAAVQSAMNELDPEGLLRLGAPADEYDSEIDDFVATIAQDVQVTEALVRRTWARWFYAAAGERACLTELTRRLEELQRAWRASR